MPLLAFQASKTPLRWRRTRAIPRLKRYYSSYAYEKTGLRLNLYHSPKPLRPFWKMNLLEKVVYTTRIDYDRML